MLVLARVCDSSVFRALGLSSWLLLAACAAGTRAGTSPNQPPHGGGAPPGAELVEDTLARAAASLDEARTARQLGNHAAARKTAREAIERLLSEDARTDSAARITMLTETARFADDVGELKAAESALKRVLEYRTRTLPEDHCDLQAARQEYAAAAFAVGDLAGARALFELVLEYRTQTLPDDHSDVQVARQNLAATIYKLGDLNGARALQEQVLTVYSRTLPEDHADMQWVRLNLASTMASLGELASARVQYEHVLAIRTRSLPEDHPDLQRARFGLAATLYKLGDFAGARTLFEEVLEVNARTLPEDHPDLLLTRLNLGATLEGQGDLFGARGLQERVVEVYSRTLPEEHPDLQLARANLAVTLLELGDLSGARALQERVLETCSRTLPEDHPSLQLARLNLAETIKAFGDLSGAQALEERALEMYLLTMPENDPDLQVARLQLGRTLKLRGDFAGARVLEERVLEAHSHTLPEDHPSLQRARQCLATTLASLGDSSGARSIQEEVLAVVSRALPEDHLDLQMVRGNLATMIATEIARDGGGDPERGRERCSSLVHALAGSCSRLVRTSSLASSSREAEERSSSLGQYLALVLSFAAGCGVFEADAELVRDAFELSESTRGSALVSARLALVARSDVRYGKLRGEIRETGQELARLAQSGATRDAYDAVVARRDRAQQELVQIASTSPDAIGIVTAPDPRALADLLSESDAVVAYRRYSHWEIVPGGGQERLVESLCAFVLRKGAGLQLVRLGSIGPIEMAAREWRLALGVADSRGLGVAARNASPSTERAAAARVRELVLDPLAQSLRGVQRLRMILDDVLQVVPIDALPANWIERGSTSATRGTTRADLVGDRYEIELFSTTQELFAKPTRPSNEPLVLLLGGADYFASASNSKHDANGSKRSLSNEGSHRSTHLGSALRGGAWSDGFPPLPGTLAEARGLEQLAKRARVPGEIVLLEQERASRESIEEFAPRARLVHLATHGWFAPESIRSWSDPDPGTALVESRASLVVHQGAEDRVKGSSPMVLCGLALAGANCPADALGRSPGLVTAEEISGWDLSTCELAVLSACDTHVGERRAGQGVNSLQKALHMAGARTVITSLWKVPDEATKELMLDFYERIWLEREPKARALWNAKKRLREATDEQGNPKYTTRDWAAWVLTGAPE
jgi:CHAT domain-containing protein/tetratricopeptide (TPR) repeat protein